MADRPIGQDDAALTDLLDPKCPECGWRRGYHRPVVTVGDVEYPACPEVARA